MSAPAKILVLATLVVPGDQAAPLATIEAQVGKSLRSDGFFVSRVDAEFITEPPASVSATTEEPAT